MTTILLKLFVPNYKNEKDPKIRTAVGKLAGWVSIAVNALLALLKILAGVFLMGGSVSVIADGVNNLSDSASGIISLLGFKLSEKPADEEHPYGHGRYEYLAGLMVALCVMLIGVELFMSSIEHILSPSPVTLRPLAIVILVFSILLKLWLMYFNKSLGRKIASDTLKATAADSRNDVLSTGAVLIAGIISHYTVLDLDGWVGVAVALFILYNGFGLVKETINPLLGRAPSPERVAELKSMVHSYPGVLGTHDLMMHDYGPGRQFASVHVELSSDTDVLEGHDLIDRIERAVYEQLGIHLVVHYDPICTTDERLSAFSMWLHKEIQTVHPELDVHDLRMVPCEEHTNVIFDCLMPHGIRMSEKQLREAVGTLVKSYDPTFVAVINIDRYYIGKSR
ncbi:MAG: cation transporter [Clostridia bacterium]|nr:cation transporter [Clostridia bacterium]MBQ8398436.1 cation transporter [Clostridia bacterium]